MREAVLDRKLLTVRNILKNYPYGINYVSTYQTCQLKSEVICVHGNKIDINQIRSVKIWLQCGTVTCV